MVLAKVGSLARPMKLGGSQAKQLKVRLDSLSIDMTKEHSVSLSVTNLSLLQVHL